MAYGKTQVEHILASLLLFKIKYLIGPIFTTISGYGTPFGLILYYINADG